MSKSAGFLTRAVQLLMIPIEELKRRHQLRVDRTDVLFLMIPIEELKRLSVTYTRYNSALLMIPIEELKQCTGCVLRSARQSFDDTY